MNYKELLNHVLQAIDLSESQDEKSAIAEVLVEHVIPPAYRLAPDLIYDQETLHTLIARVNQNEPVQYVVGEAWFFGRPFFVDASVLIPRPETEELVEWVLDRETASRLRVWDAGTGSGCIPVTLSAARPLWDLFATDVSAEALAVAQRNANKFNVAIEFLQHDLVGNTIPRTDLDFIVSNPPYIAHEEAHTLATRVRAYEPALALFAPEPDPLFFYRRLIFFASRTLKPGGRLYVEINERLDAATADLFRAAGFTTVELKRDLSAKNRMICARNLH